MVWIVAALVGYVATALASVADKFLVSDRIEKPAAYVFFITVFSLVSFALAPFGLSILPIETLAIFFASGVCFAWSLLFLYRAFQNGEVSKILPLAGIFAALVSIIPSIAMSVLSGDIPTTGLLAFLFLIVGAAILSLSGPEGMTYSRKNVGLSLLSGFFLALFYFLLKFGEGAGANFINGLVWSRCGVFLGGLSFLIVPSYRRDIVAFAFEIIIPSIRNSWRTVFFPVATRIGTVPDMDDFYRREDAGRYRRAPHYFCGVSVGSVGCDCAGACRCAVCRGVPCSAASFEEISFCL